MSGQTSGPGGRAILLKGNSRGLKLYPAPHKGGRGERSPSKTISKRIALNERSIKKKRVSVMDGSREAGKGEVQGRVSWWTCLLKHGQAWTSKDAHGQARSSMDEACEPAWARRTNFCRRANFGADAARKKLSDRAKAHNPSNNLINNKQND